MGDESSLSVIVGRILGKGKEMKRGDERQSGKFLKPSARFSIVFLVKLIYAS